MGGSACVTAGTLGAVSAGKGNSRSALTFIEIVGAHGVPNERGEVGDLLAAGEELLREVPVQVRAPHHHVAQHHLLEPRLEGGVHGRVCDHNGAGLDPCENKG